MGHVWVQGTEGVAERWADCRILASSWFLVTVCHSGTHGGLGLLQQAVGGVCGRSLAPVDTMIDAVSYIFLIIC